MYGSWWKQTKNFNLIRIAELLTLWEKDSDKALIVNYIKEDYKRWNIDENDERKIKNEFSDIKTMSEAVIKMVNESIEAYVNGDVSLAKKVIEYDDKVDNAFTKIRNTLITNIANNTENGEYAIDLIMIAKYFERIGDHAVNIAEWSEFSVTGIHK